MMLSFFFFLKILPGYEHHFNIDLCPWNMERTKECHRVVQRKGLKPEGVHALLARAPIK